MDSLVILIVAATIACASTLSAQGTLNLRDGDVCKEGPPPKYCRYLEDCQGINQSDKKLTVCSYDGEEPIVCCDIGGEKEEITSTTTPAQSTESIATKKEGDICKEGPPPSYCRHIKDCQDIKQSQRKPEVCSHDGEEPIVCCDIGDKQKETTSTVALAQSTESIADKKCKHYAEYIYQWEFPLHPLPDQSPRNVSYCEIVAKPLIVGVEDAKLREFPHMARIGYGPENNITWYCGGSLISENFVLSAAHCTKINEIYASWVNLGDLDTSTDRDRPVTIMIIERINHPGYKGTPIYHDIALYKLERNAPLGINIRPLCLNTKRYIQEKETALVSGWGHRLFGNKSSTSNILRKVQIGFVPNEACNNSYRPYINENSFIPKGINPDYMLCAGGVTGKDTSQGDSGGPLQILVKEPHCMYAIVGIVSFGVNNSAEVPGLYTNVAHYVPWIESIVWPNGSRASGQSIPIYLAVFTSLLLSLFNK